MNGSWFPPGRHASRSLRRFVAMAVVASVAVSCSDGEPSSEALVDTVDDRQADELPVDASPAEDPPGDEPVDEPAGDEPSTDEPVASESLPNEDPTDEASSTEVSSTEVSSTEVSSTEAPVDPGPVKVELRTGELVIDHAALSAGTIEFEASNFEEIGHIFAVARGDSYESLPQLSNGAVDRDVLGDDFIVKTGILIEGLGNVRVVSVDLAPGNYVLYCNGGDDEDEVSHASLGEVLTISVVE